MDTLSRPGKKSARALAHLLEFKGLNFYGPTIIKEEGAAITHSIFSLWADLFSHGPFVLELTGGWSWTEGEPMESARYKTIVEIRDTLVSALRRVSEYARQVSESEGQLYVLHMGI